MLTSELRLENKQPLLMPQAGQLVHARLDAGHSRVRMNQSGEIIVAEGGQGKISTSGLCGCTAVAAVMKLQDNSHRLYLQHYAPRHSSTGIEGLEQYLTSVKAEDRLIGARVVIMHPGDPSKPETIHDTGTYWLLAVAEHTLKGTEVAVQHYPYDTQRTFRVLGAGTLEAAIDSKNEPLVFADLKPLQVLGEREAVMPQAKLQTSPETL